MTKINLTRPRGLFIVSVLDNPGSWHAVAAPLDLEDEEYQKLFVKYMNGEHGGDYTPDEIEYSQIEYAYSTDMKDLKEWAVKIQRS